MKRKGTILIISMIIILLALLGTKLLLEGLKSDELSLEKQWYLNNTGFNLLPEEGSTASTYASPKKGIDISGIEMWELYQSSPNNCEVIVALIDTGIDYTHPNLVGAIWTNPLEIEGDCIDNDGNGYIDDVHGFNFCDKTGDIATYDQNPIENRHGTMCAGIVAAKNNDGTFSGVAGVANVKVMSLKVLSNNEGVSNANLEKILQAIRYAENQGAAICNMSLGTETDYPELEAAMAQSKMLFVVSSGNGPSRGVNIDAKPYYPASYSLDNMIVVANLNYNGKLNKTSNYGINSVDVAAPGTNIYSTDINGKYYYLTGTSMAAPMVSGIAALLYSQCNSLEAAEIKTIIIETVTPLEYLSEKIASGGIVNGASALKKIIN